MAVLAESGSNPDVDLLYDINGLAKDAPHWFDRVVEFVGEYGLLVAMVLLVVWCWWSVRRRGDEDSAASVAGLVWAPVAMYPHYVMIHVMGSIICVTCRGQS